MTQHPESALKPCPFCGGTEITMEGVFDDGEFICVKVDCAGCDFFQDYASEEEAFKKWNTRPTPSASPSDEAVKTNAKLLVDHISHMSKFEEPSEGDVIHLTELSKFLDQALKRLVGQKGA